MTSQAQEIVVTIEPSPEINVILEATPEINVFLDTTSSETNVVLEPAPDIFTIISDTGLPGSQGPIGPQGPPGISGDSVAFYEYIQLSAAATWIITHNLGFNREPTVVLDSDPTRPVWADVLHGSLNQTTIIFPSPVTGKAYF